MSRIVFTTMGTYGDLYPQIAIALELRHRGHDVAFATHQEYQDIVESHGFEFHRMRPDNTAMSNPEEMARAMDLKTGTEYIFKNIVCANLQDTYTDLMASAQDADLIMMGECVLAARLVAEKRDIPWVFAVLQPVSFMSHHDPSVLPIFTFLSKIRGLGWLTNRIIFQLAHNMTKSWAEPVHQLRHELGLPALQGNPILKNKFSPYLVLALFSEAFAKPQTDWPSNSVSTGFPFFDGNDTESELPSELQTFLDAGAPPIVFTLGSAAVLSPGCFYQVSIEAAQRLKRRAVLLMGNNPMPKNLPENMLALRYIPHSQIFPHACAIVHQGGVGTMAQALRAGVPTVVMPYSHDQPDNAARVERLGTSRTISRKKYTVSRVEKVLGQLLSDPGYAARAKDIGKTIRGEDGVAIACDAIEKLLKSSE